MTARSVPVVAFNGHEETLLARVAALGGTGRAILGICGPPGAGKSTLAAWLVNALPTEKARLVSMDGFHLSNAVLASQGLAHRKGAPETFDADGYAALLNRLRRREEAIVYAPEYDRAHGESIAASAAVGREVPLVVTEGNYLLAEGRGWNSAREHMDEVWFVDVDPDLRRRRLCDRHVRFGKAPAAARAWVKEVDEVNAAVVDASRIRADLAVRLVDDLNIPGAD